MKYMRKKGETTPIVFDEHLYDAEVYEVVGDTADKPAAKKAPAKKSAAKKVPAKKVEDTPPDEDTDTGDLFADVDEMLEGLDDGEAVD